MPYAPYNKGDKLGKSADWTSNYHRNQFQSACSLSRVMHRTPCTSFDRLEMVAEGLSFCDARPNAPTHTCKRKRKRKRKHTQAATTRAPATRSLRTSTPRTTRTLRWSTAPARPRTRASHATPASLAEPVVEVRLLACSLARAVSLAFFSHCSLSISRSLIGQIATSASTQGTTAAGLRGEGTLRNAQARLVVAARATTSIVDMAAYVRLFARLPRRKRRRRLTKASVGVCARV